MNLSEELHKAKNSIIDLDTDYLKNFRNNFIEKFNLEPKIIKNNESLKHFHIPILSNLEIKLNENFRSHEHDNQLKDFLKIFSINENKEFVVRKIKEHNSFMMDDYIHNLNTFFMNSGFIYDIESNKHNSILFINNNIRSNNTIFSKNFFRIKAGCNLTIVEYFSNQTNNDYELSNLNILNDFEIENNSKVSHLIIYNHSDKANLQSTNIINCHEAAEYKQIVFNSSKCSLRNHNYAILKGSESRAELLGIFFGNKDQIIDNKSEVNHIAQSCTSNQKYKGILTDSAKASYLSKTHVNKDAQKTEAYQLSKGILLSDKSHFHSKPELKIFADDVKCSHGSTIGPFDQNILYYLRSRGIKKNIAISLLINSFFSDILDNTSNAKFLNKVKILIDDWLTTNKYQNV